MKKSRMHYRFRAPVVMLFGFLLALSTLCKAQDKKQKERPNILFIAVDDLRTTIESYGDEIAITPNMDKLAEHGTVFLRAYSQQAVCSPSRTSLMTGLRPDSTKVWNLNTHFREHIPDAVTLPQYFKRNGYHTQLIGKIYHDSKKLQDSVSWSVPETLEVTGEVGGKYVLKKNLNTEGSWKAASVESAQVADSAYIDGRVANAAIEILNEIKDRPFFLAVGFRRPHLPFSAPQKYWDMYNKESIFPPAFPHPPKDVPSLALHESKELRGYTDVPDLGPLTEEKIRELRHGYYASTTFVDAQIGKVLDELDRLGLRKNTIVVLWSDHGYHLGEHDLWCKTTNFELDTRVPLIISSPAQKQKGTHTDAIVELVDLYPTLVSLSGLRVPEGLAGSSIAQLLDDPNQVIKRAAYSQFPRPWFYKGQPSVMGYSVRTNDFRYTEWQDFTTGEILARELYDHRIDPKETVNLAVEEEHAQKVDELHELLLPKKE